MDKEELLILLAKHKQVRTILLQSMKVVWRHIGSTNIMLILFRELVN